VLNIDSGLISLSVNTTTDCGGSFNALAAKVFVDTISLKININESIKIANNV